MLKAASEAFGMLKRGEIPASISSRESALQSNTGLFTGCNRVTHEPFYTDMWELQVAMKPQLRLSLYKISKVLVFTHQSL